MQIDAGGGVTFAALANGGNFWGSGLQHVGGEVHTTVRVTPHVGVELSPPLTYHKSGAKNATAT